MTLSSELSPREQEVARLISDDLSDKEIASILQISTYTVQTYLKRIMRKLSIDHAQLARRRMIRRWIDGDKDSEPESETKPAA